MKDKENQIFDKYGNYDFPTEIKQDGLNNATSQIEEMAKEIAKRDCYFYDKCNRNPKHNCISLDPKIRLDSDKNYVTIATWLVNAGYRNCKDTVVLSRQEWKQIKNSLYYNKEALEKKLDQASKETAEKFMVLRGYVTKQFHRYHEARDIAESEYKKCKEEMGKAILNNDWHRCDAIMFILEDIATKFDELAKQFGCEIKGE